VAPADDALMTFLFPALLAALVAAAVTGVLVPIVTRIALAVQAMDHPGGRKDHAIPVPRLGGVAVVFGLGVSLLFAAFWLRSVGALLLPRNELLGLALATFMVFLVGIVDDISGVSTLDKFVVEVLAAFLIVRLGWSFGVLGLPGGVNLDLGAFGAAASVLWIVGVTNAINLIDGLDGLAGGVVAIIAGSFFVYAALQGDALTIVAMAAVIGACLGFLRYNWAPARIYLGDSGSLTLGFVLATTSVQSSLKAPAAIAILVPILALGLPVIDTLLVMAVRFVERPKGPISSRLIGMFHPDRNHLHHMLLSLAKTRRRAVVWIYAAVVVFCALALTVAVTRSMAVGGVLLATEVVAVVAMRRLGLRAGARTLAEEQRRQTREAYLSEPSGARY
jgi:UDP-GlcNAc:undecaprenyl-phosphate/decaprenyl-phosphate GlcNAc-1-phosphate transferase